MSSINRQRSNLVRAIGLLGIMIALVGALATVPFASAASLAGDTTPNGKLAVYATDAATGSRVVGANVVVIDAKGTTIIKGTTGASGFFSAELSQGIYKVVVFASG